MKKRILSLTLALAMIMAFVPCTVGAEISYHNYYENLYYTKYDDYIEITDCDESTTSVDIPAGIDGLPVTIIGDWAFEDCDSLTNVTIPSSVTSIGNCVFSGCGSLNISVDSGNKNYSDIDGVLFNKDETEIIAYAKDKIQPEYSIPDSVTSIGDDAFEYCYSLMSVKIGNGVTSIGEYAFSGCGSLNISVDSGNKNYSDTNGVLFNKDKTEIIAYAKDKIQPEYSIPTSVTSIGERGFYGCDSLTRVTIPNSVTSIGGEAFKYCDSLTSVTIPNSVASIGVQAFFNCGNLTSVTIGTGITSIGDNAFEYCYSLMSVKIGNGVTSIGSFAFSGCSSLANIKIPDSVTSIGMCAFSCSSLNISVDSNNKNYSDINGVLFNKNKTEIIAYAKDEIQPEYTIPSGVTSIGDYAFKNCYSLTSVTIPNSVASIGVQAFCNCIGLTSVTIPSSVTNIGDNAFLYCDSLTGVTIGTGVTSIGYGAFACCYSLTDVYYSGTEAQWSNIDIGSSNDSLINATIHYNSTGPSIKSVTHTQEVDSKHYGATKFKYTPEGEVYAAATAYNKALEEYLKAVKSEAKKTAKGNKTLKEKAQSLIIKDKSAKYKYLRFTTGTGTIPEQPEVAAYMALAEYFDYLADTAESKLNIDLDDEAYMIDAKLTKQILSKVGHYSKTSQQNGWTVSMNIVSFAKQGTGYMTIKKGSLSYYAIFSSSPKDVRDALNNFLGEIRDVTDDITKSAAKSLYAEISDITGFGNYFHNLTEYHLSNVTKTLRKHGFGNVLKIFKKCSDGYDVIRGIIAFSDARHIQDALSNAEDIYNKLSKLDYSDDAVDNFIIKQAMDKVNNAKNTLCDELYDYMYSIGKPPKKEGFFDKVTSWMKSVFQCPVDFTVYNTDGEVIGYVSDGEVYYNDDIFIETSGDVKNLYVPSGMEVRIEMIGTDEGEFNYVLEEVADDEPIGRLNYYGIPLTEGASFEQTLDSGSIANGTDKPISSQDGDINADEYLSADDLTAFVTVETECGDEGVVIGAGDYAKGDSVELTALASDDKYTLSGWYIGDELVSTDETYRFTALENVIVRAEFARNYDADYDYNTEMSDDYGDYYAYVYKDSDDSRGIIITPFVETPNESLDIYLTMYGENGYVISEDMQYSAQLDGTERYDFENIDLQYVKSIVLTDSDNVTIATINPPADDSGQTMVETLGKYRDSAEVTTYKENGAVVIDFYMLDDTIDTNNIFACIAEYDENGTLLKGNTLTGNITENGVRFTVDASAEGIILFWDKEQSPITEAVPVNME